MSKKSKHARNQAKYMQRKRDAGLEWLTEWVPEPALHAFKAIAKAARKSHAAPDPAQLAAAEVLAAGGEALPDWARRSDILLSVWLLSQTAAGALEQAHAEREAAKGRKGETTATDAETPAERTPADETPPVAAAEPMVDMEIKATSSPTPEPASPAPVRRARRKATPPPPSNDAG